jgi:hypothetical protein
MKLAALLLSLLWLTGCAARSPEAPARAFLTLSHLPPKTEGAHSLVLVSPVGTGQITLTRTTTWATGSASTRYSSDGAISITDEAGQWRFSYKPTSLNGTYPLILGLHGIGIAFKNTSPYFVEFDWTRSVFVDPSGRASRVIHSGVRFNERSNVTAPSIIPPGAILEDFVFPSDGITMVGGSVSTSPYWAAPPMVEDLRAGMEISVVLAVKVGDRQSPKTFRLAVNAPAEERARPPEAPPAERPAWCMPPQEWIDGTCWGPGARQPRK